MQIIIQFVYWEGKKEKTWEGGGRKTFSHFFVPLSRLSPGDPWWCFRAGSWSWALPEAALLQLQGELPVCFLYWRARAFGVLTPTPGKASIEMISKELCWKLPQQLPVQSRMGCSSSHKSSPCWETSLAFWVLNWATFGARTRLCKLSLC